MPILGNSRKFGLRPIAVAGNLNHSMTQHDPRNQAEHLERLELALRASNEGIWDWHINKPSIHYTRRILEFLECGDGNAPNIFLAPYPFIHEEDRRVFSKAIATVIDTAGPEILAVDARVRSGSGAWRWLRIRGFVVRDRSGAAQRIAGSMIDISLRKAAEAELEEERSILRQLIDRVPLQIYFKNHKSEFVMVNQGLAKWHGFEDPSQILGKHDRDFFDEVHWRPAERDERMIMETGVAITNKLEQETWNTDKETWVITSKFPWFDRFGKIRGTFGVSSDVTELVHAQQRASALAGELHHRNAAYEEELLLAREIQQAFASADFPRLSGPGMKLVFGARHIPISGMAGDFHEVIQVDDHRVGLLICDVMGHGVRSALVVSMLRGLLEKSRTLAGNPGQFLGALNEGLVAILGRAGVTMFATAFYGVIDLRESTFAYACAGHPGPVISDGLGGTRQIGSERAERGPALGLIAATRFPQSQTAIGTPCRMILHTDGVLEAENPHGELFERHLTEVIGCQKSAPLEIALDGILQAVLDFSSNRAFDDDVCLLACDLLPD